MILDSVQGCPEAIPELIHGKPVIVEKLFNLSFNISPQVSVFSLSMKS
jgi:hypothetical protein